MFCFVQISQNIDGFRQNNSQGFNIIHKTLNKTKPVRDFFFFFTIYQNYTLA